MTLHRPESITQLATLRGEPLAGGTDLYERLHSGVSQGAVVDLNGLPDFAVLSGSAAHGLSIGAGVQLSTLAADERVASGYPGLAATAGTLATPQIRNVATVGGVLCQRTRCTWYRHPNLSCAKNGGEGCPARESDNDHGVLFDLGPCVHPHPSSVALAMLIYDASFDTNLRAGVGIAELYGDGSDPVRDHQLNPGEILLRVHLPPRKHHPELLGIGYSRLMGREAAEWPWVECLVQLTVEEDTVISARVAVGAVATIPLRLAGVEQALIGVRVGDLEGATVAARLASDAAPIYRPNRHKLEMLHGTLLDAIEKAWSLSEARG